jgi:hypothetical protein
MDMLSRGFCSCLMVGPGGAIRGGVEHSKGKDGERAMAILRFQCGSLRLCRLSTASFCPRWQALTCTHYISGSIGPSKPNSPVTTLSNRTSLLRSGLLEGE